MEENNQNGISSAEMYRLEIAELTKEKYTLLKRIKELVDENNLLKWDNNEEEHTRRMDIIGQNGNTGEHYEVVDEQNRNK
jgi:hypothetical protein